MVSKSDSLKRITMIVWDLDSGVFLHLWEESSEKWFHFNKYIYIYIKTENWIDLTNLVFVTYFVVDLYPTTYYLDMELIHITCCWNV